MKIKLFFVAIALVAVAGCASPTTTDKEVAGNAQDEGNLTSPLGTENQDEAGTTDETGETGGAGGGGEEIAKAVGELEIRTSSLSKGYVNTNYTKTLKARGGVEPYTWIVTGLPEGLTQKEDQIGGQPSWIGESDVKITLIDSEDKSVEKNLKLSVDAKGELFKVEMFEAADGTDEGIPVWKPLTVKDSKVNPVNIRWGRFFRVEFLGSPDLDYDWSINKKEFTIKIFWKTPKKNNVRYIYPPANTKDAKVYKDLSITVKKKGAADEGLKLDFTDATVLSTCSMSSELKLKRIGGSVPMSVGQGASLSFEAKGGTPPYVWEKKSIAKYGEEYLNNSTWKISSNGPKATVKGNLEYGTLKACLDKVYEEVTVTVKDQCGKTANAKANITARVNSGSIKNLRVFSCMGYVTDTDADSNMILRFYAKVPQKDSKGNVINDDSGNPVTSETAIGTTTYWLDNECGQGKDDSDCWNSRQVKFNPNYQDILTTDISKIELEFNDPRKGSADEILNVYLHWIKFYDTTGFCHAQYDNSVRLSDEGYGANVVQGPMPNENNPVKAKYTEDITSYINLVAVGSSGDKFIKTMWLRGAAPSEEDLFTQCDGEPHQEN